MKLFLLLSSEYLLRNILCLLFLPLFVVKSPKVKTRVDNDIKMSSGEKRKYQKDNNIKIIEGRKLENKKKRK